VRRATAQLSKYDDFAIGFQDVHDGHRAKQVSGRGVFMFLGRGGRGLWHADRAL
jgi:hypothetical protein